MSLTVCGPCRGQGRLGGWLGSLVQDQRAGPVGAKEGAEVAVTDRRRTERRSREVTWGQVPELAVHLGWRWGPTFPSKQAVHPAKPLGKPTPVLELDCIFDMYHMSTLKSLSVVC